MISKDSRFFRSTSVLIGTIVGAGIFGLPYAFAQSGFLIGMAYLAVMAVLFFLINLCYAEVILRTHEKLEIAGYAEKYLGKKGKVLITISLILGIFSALIAYTIGVGEFLDALLTPVIGGSPFIWSLVFWALASSLILKGIGIVSRLEAGMTLFLMAVVIFVFFQAWPYVQIENLKTIYWSKFLFPYGAVLFSMCGAVAIPTMRRILGDQAHLLKKSLALGMIIPIIIYVLFCFAIVGVTGVNTSETALIGLKAVTGGKAILVGGIFGILAMTTSFLALGYFLRELFYKDYKFPLIGAWLITVGVPLIFFILGLRSFIRVIAFAGGTLSGFQGIVLLMTYYQAKKKGERQPEFKINLPRLLAYFIYLVLFFGIVYQFIHI
jgi:tyrosine-specific transport protein